MKRLTLLLLAVVLGLSSYAQKSSLLLGPDKNFLITFHGNWDRMESATVSIVTASISQSDIISINQGGPQIYLSYTAFLNTTPCYTVGYITATITVHSSTGRALRAATVQLKNIFYYDYPLNLTYFRYYDYYIPDGAWRLFDVPTPGLIGN